MATFFGGLIIGLVNCWQVALLTLATGPFIVAAGGISNIFLHRLAENIQDAYAEAASIAEQVKFNIIFCLFTSQITKFQLQLNRTIVLPFANYPRCILLRLPFEVLLIVNQTIPIP